MTNSRGCFWLGWLDPTKAPVPSSSFKRIRLAKRILRKQGWELKESVPWLRVFVRAKRKNTWLHLVIQGDDTPTLALTVKDIIDRSAGKSNIIGVATSEPVTTDFIADAERNGIFIVRFSEFDALESHITRLQGQIKQREKTWEASFRDPISTDAEVKVADTEVVRVDSPALAEPARKKRESNMPISADCTIFYMCEPGRLEWQSICLASSLLAFCAGRIRVQAFCSSEKVALLKTETKDFHARHNISITPIPTQIEFGRNYNVGNKVIATSHVDCENFAVLMDTDTMLVSNFHNSDLAVDKEIKAFPTNPLALRFSKENWNYVYKKFDLTPPTRRYRFDMKDGAFDLSLPYFNAGVIAFPTRLANSQFGQTWLETTKRLDQDSSIPSKHPWLDQISLPIAIERLHLETIGLDRTFNFPIEEEEKQVRSDVKIIHYHFGTNLISCSLSTLIDQIIKEFSDFETAKSLLQHYNNIGLKGSRE